MSEPRVLICGLNWIGDSIMALPALNRLAAEFSGPISVLSKPGLAALWRMMPGVDEVLELASGSWGTVATGLRLRDQSFRRAIILPNSVRSAMVPFLAGIPERRGVSTPGRAGLLTDRLQVEERLDRYHQAWEYVSLLLPQYSQTELPPLPRLQLSVDDQRDAGARLPETDHGWVAIMPGAARGPAKRWPAESFAEVGRRLAAEPGCRVVLMGGTADRDVCQAVGESIGAAAVNLAGQTSLPQWAAMLGRCRVAIANDSGGMHLAAAMGTPVVAIYGQTDPARTGPLGLGTVLQQSETRNRTIARDSEQARLSLASVQPMTVYEAAQLWLKSGTNPPTGA